MGNSLFVVEEWQGTYTVPLKGVEQEVKDMLMPEEEILFTAKQ